MKIRTDIDFLLRSSICLIAGMLTTLAFSPFDQYWLVFVTLAVAITCWEGRSPKQSFWMGWFFGLGLQGTGVSWIFYSLHYHGGAPVLFAIVLILLLAAYLAIYTGAAIYLVSRFNKLGPEIRLLLIYPASFAIFEWSQGIVLTGFSWMQLGYTQIDLPLSGFAPLFGNHFVGALVVMSAGLVVIASRTMRMQRSDYKVASGIVVVLWAVGLLLKQVHWTQEEGEWLDVSLIQGNIPQHEKWKRSNRMSTLSLYRDLIYEQKDADLIVLPETALPGYRRWFMDYLARIKTEVEKNNTEVLVGLFVKNPNQDRYYNAVIDLNGQQYLKRHLVPLGEYIPLRFLIGFFNRWLNIPMSDIDSGDSEQSALKISGFPVGMSICFEDAFARDVLTDLPEARLLINVSNDAWFEDSHEPHQHHSIARMRALETGRYMLRSTNTGVTSIIGPKGEEIALAPQFETHVLKGRVKQMTGSTPYVIWGDWMLLFICLSVIGSVVIFQKRRTGE